MERKNRIKNIKVGIAAIVALALLGFSFWAVGSLRLSSRTYVLSILFRDVSGIEEGAPVMMAGVKIGGVENVRLTPASRALVKVRIKDTVQIPIGSAVRITSKSFLGDNYIEVVPGPRGTGHIQPGRTITGMSSVGMADLLPQVSGVLARLDKVGASVQNLLEDQKFRQGLHSTIRNLDLTAAAALGLVNDLRGVTAQGKGQVDVIAANLISATGKMASASSRIDNLLQGVGKEDIEQITGDLKDAAHQLDQTSANVASLSGDQQIRDDLKASLKNAREATESAKTMIDRLSDKLGLGKTSSRPPAKLSPRPPSGVGASFDLLYDTRHSISRVDANYTVQFNGPRFYRAGLYDIGENTRVNVQVGKVLKEGQALRWGLYQSRIGLGYDWQANPRWYLQADLYHPNLPTLDIKGRLQFNEGVGAWLGFENLGRDNRPVLGLQYKF